MRFITLFVMIAALTFPSVAQTSKNDKKKTANELGVVAGGVIYSLPRTGIRITVEVEQEKYFRGPYADYAQKYLGIKGSSATDYDNWSFTGVKMETFGEPDPTEVYKASGSVASLLSLTESGILAGINSEVKTGSEKVYTSDFTPKLKVPLQVWDDVSMHSFLAEKDSIVQAGTKFKSFEEKAAEAAKDILKLRKRKALALAANYDKLPPDGDAYKVMVKELDNIIENYVALFTGKTFKAKYSYTFEVVPQGKGSNAVVAFRFSPSAGVLPENNVSGKPIMLELEPLDGINQKAGQLAIPAAGETHTKGVNYRVPGFANVRLLNGSEVIAQSRFALGQLGSVTTIPDGLLNGDYTIEFHPTTGAIKNIMTY